ncbi:unnamed protein product [Echinostoma caproni]|uniref:TMEM131_like domain-containing protein n=1 Tax=Echinostoma caproni TaxID=27848 RepID=A0A183ASR1_9TREM|nr:unnamed protein product [Echinostoma caproni]
MLKTYLRNTSPENTKKKVADLLDDIEEFVGSIALYVPPSQSSQSNSEINGTKIFQGDTQEPLIIAPHQTTSLLTFDLPVNSAFCFAVVSYCHNLSCSSDCASVTDCVEAKSAEYETTNLESLTQVTMVPTSYASEPGLLAQTSLLHFGTVSQSTGALTRHIKLINPLKYDVSIVGLETDIFDSALSLNLSARTIPAESLIPWSVATLTVSPANVTHSRQLTGFVMLVTSVRGATVKIPFFAKLVHGALVVHERRAVMHDLSPPRLRFDYVFHNQADIPVSVTKPQLPHSYRDLVRIQIEKARLLDGVYNLGTVLLNQQGNSTVVLYNRNPIEIEIEAFGVSTALDPADAWRLVIERTESGTECNSVCLVHSSNETCVSCPVSVFLYLFPCIRACLTF